MMAGFEPLVAWRYLGARRQERAMSLIAMMSLAGIMLGVATLIVVLSVMNGFRAELVRRIVGLESDLRITAVAAAGEQALLSGGLEEPIAAVLGDRGTMRFPVIEGQALVSGRGHAGGAVVRGMRSLDLARKPVLAAGIGLGGVAELSGDRTLAGASLLGSFGARPGDRLSLTVVTLPDETGQPGIEKRTLTVVGSFRVGMHEFDGGYLFVPLETADRLFPPGSRTVSLEVFADDLETADAVRLAAALGEELGPGYVVETWRDRRRSLAVALDVERTAMFFVMTLIVLVAAFNIISSLVMLVKEKAREIAILRTMGATKGSVARIFLMAGAGVGVSGTALGVALGTGIAAYLPALQALLAALDSRSGLVWFLTRMPVDLQPGDVVAVSILAFSIAVFATVYPAWRAAALDPVEALRYE